MKISKETVAVLKNFASINPNLMLKEGSTLSTISIGKSLVGIATITEQIPQDFGVYDINEFLGVLSLFEEPEINFEDKYLTITQGKSNVKYFAADPAVLTFPKKTPPLADAEIEFNLTSANISAILKTSSVLKTSDVRFVGDGTTLSIIIGDKKNQTANNFILEIGETDKTFSISISTENLKIIPQDFKAEIINRRMVRLSSETLTYIIAIETDSTFSE